MHRNLDTNKMVLMQQKRTMILATWNIRGIKAKLTDVTREIKELNVHASARTGWRKVWKSRNVAGCHRIGTIMKISRILLTDHTFYYNIGDKTDIIHARNWAQVLVSGHNSIYTNFIVRKTYYWWIEKHCSLIRNETNLYDIQIPREFQPTKLNRRKSLRTTTDALEDVINHRKMK